MRSAQQVHWKVRFWDARGIVSDWSEPATWTMGIIAKDDWQGTWITASMIEGSTRMPIFRKAFSIDKPARRAMVYFCGLGQHELHLNGKVVGQDVIDPGWTNYRKTCLYATHDVTTLLQPGANALGMMLGNGMYNVIGGRYAKFEGSFGPPKMILQLQVEFEDGTTRIVSSDQTWQATQGPITFSCIYGGEDFDARLEMPGWDTPAFDASTWSSAIVTDAPGGTLRSQAQPPIRVMQTFKPLKVSESKNGARVYDLGQNMSGRPRLTIAGESGDRVTLKTGELLTADGEVSQKHIGSPVSFSYTCSGRTVPETWQPRFSYHGFRYVQATGAALVDIEGQFTYSSARVVGQFECSDPQLNQIHQLILNAIRSNMQSVLTDCPHREKLGWLEQSHLMGPAILFNYDLPLLYEKISQDMREARYENGFVPTIAPQYTVFGKTYDMFNDSPEWGSAVVINPWLIYQRFGDRKILEDNYDAMKAYVEYLHGGEIEGIVAHGLGDWYDIGPKPPGVSQLTSMGVTATAIYYFDAIVLCNTARLLGKGDDVDRYQAQADRIRAAFNAKFFDPAKKQYDRNSQTANAMPLALWLVDDEHRPAVLANLIADIRAHENHITAGDIGFMYVIRALAEGGRSDVILDLLKRTDPPSYGSQLARGATTLTEAWDANPDNSQNHLMLGHAETWFYEYLAGIQIDLSKPANEQLVIRPAIVKGIDWAKASYESIRGTITSDWKVIGPRGSLAVTIPANSTASIVLPGLAPQFVAGGQHQFEFDAD